MPNLFNRALKALRRTRAQEPGTGRRWFWGHSHAGIYVDEDIALKHAAVWSCVRVISETLGYVPCHVYEWSEESRTRRPDSRVETLLNIQPNEEMTAFDLNSTLFAHALTWGNGYAEIDRDGAGRPAATWLITPDRVNPDRLRTGTRAGRLFYDISNGTGPNTTLEPRDVFHLRGLGFDGLRGYSVIQYAHECIGMGLAMDQFAGSFFGNGASLSGVVSIPHRMSPEGRTKMQNHWREAFSGSTNAFKVAVLEESAKFERIGIAPGDAQLIEQRRYQVSDICRWFRVPPHKVFELSQGSYNTNELQSQEFVQDALMPWAARFEQEANIKLFGQRDIGRMYARFNFGALLRGSSRDRAEYYRVLRNLGAISANEIRALEEMNPIEGEGGDLYIVQGQYVSLEQVAKLAEAGVAPNPFTPQPDPDAAPDPEQDAEEDEAKEAAARRIHRIR